MIVRLVTFLLLLSGLLRAQAGAVSPDLRWKIEITQERHQDATTGYTSDPHVRLILHDLFKQRDEIVWDQTGDWLPSSDDALAAIWRSDSRAFTLPDVARKFRGFSVCVREQVKWVCAYQANDFLDKIGPLWKLTNAEFNGVQQGGVVTDLRWDESGRLQFEFRSSEKIKTRFTEEVIAGNDHPKVIYVAGTPDKSND